MIIDRLPRRLRIVFGMQEPAPSDASKDPGPPLREFIAYAADCQVSGQVALEAGRITDLLNAHDEYELVNVQLESLVDGHVVACPVVLVARDELLAVHASGPAGSRSQRTHTRAHPILVHAEPYLIRGYLHALPTADPIASFRHRKPMVPLTDAWIEYLAAGRPVHRSLGTIVVNRELADWFELAVEEEVEPPELPVGATGPLTKDFTNEVLRPV
jgi:hypothetical protein